MWLKGWNYKVREPDVCMLSVLSVTSTLCLQLHFVFQLRQKKKSTECSKRKRHNQKRLGAKVICTDSLPHKAHEGQRVYSAPVCTQGTGEIGTEDIAFSSTSCSRGERGGTTTRVQITEGRYSLAVRNPVSSEHDPQI